MPRPFRVLAVGVVLVLATIGGAASASAAPELPDSMAAVGDSITQAVDVCCFYGNWPGHSWSTGNVPLDGIASHYGHLPGPVHRDPRHAAHRAARRPRVRGLDPQPPPALKRPPRRPAGPGRLAGRRDLPLDAELLQCARRSQAVIDRERELNDVLREVCATWSSNCRFDNYLTYDYAFTRAMVSKLDFFHPSLRGQATLAALTWEASWWGT
jgi:hypothetical protein